MLRSGLFHLTIALSVLAPAAHAVVVSQDNSATYTTAPVTDDFGFESVGRVFNSFAGIFATGVHLGDGWVISTFHNVSNGAGVFQFGSVVFGGTSYSVDPLTASRLHNPDTSFTDLAVFRLTAVPAGTPAVNLAGVAPLVGTAARMMGNGNDRMLTETQWSTATSPWTEVGSGGNRVGYKLQPGSQTMRWGNNNIESLPAAFPDLGYGPAITFTTDFGDSFLTAPSGEAQATGGDSGGGVFTKNTLSNEWELSGIMVTAAGFTGQPSATVAYRNVTYAINIATYQNEIATIIAAPEPSSALLILLGAGLAARRRR